MPRECPARRRGARERTTSSTGNGTSGERPEVALLAEGLDPARGGAERAIRAVAEALARRGVAAWAYAPAGREGPPLTAPARVVGVPLPALPRAAAALLLARRAAAALLLARRLAARARADGAARVVACGKLLGADLYWPHGGVHAASRAAALVGRGPLPRLGRALRPAEWAYDAIDRAAFGACRRGAARAAALSQRVRREIARRHGLAPEAVLVLRNGVAERFAPPGREAREAARRALTRRIGAPPDAPVALFCAHAFRLKGLDAALAAAARVPGLHLAVVGGGDPRPFLPAAARLGLAGRLAFLGAAADPLPLYQGATCLLHPSRYDPGSLVLLEALACGLPAVASAEDGSSELVREGEGGFVVDDPSDVAALADRLTRLLDPTTRAALAQGAAAARRTWDEVAAELLAAVERRP